MAQSRTYALSVLCTLLSFAYLCHSFKHHYLTEHPRLPSILILFLAGLLAGLIFLFVSIFSGKLAGADGHFLTLSRPGQSGSLASTDRASSAADTGFNLPARPRRYCVPVLLFCIGMRLEVLARFSHKQKCASLGVESWLCLLIAVYNTVTWRGICDVPEPEELDDNPWRSFFDDFKEWMGGPRAQHCLTIFGVAAISMGSSAAANQTMRSTYVCSASLDSRSLVMFLQIVGLALDAGIIVNMWRILVWARGFREKLRTLSKLFLIASISAAFVSMAFYLNAGYRSFSIELEEIYGINVLADSFALTVLATSATVWACEVTPMMPLVSMTSVLGTGRAAGNIVSLGDWTHTSRSASLLPLFPIAFGFVIFLHVNDIRHVAVFRRSLVIVFVCVLLVACTMLTFIRPLNHLDGRHPVDDLVYQARTVHERWLLQAATSQSLAVAVKIYEERHGGRAPPPKFGEWYQFASGSAVIDEFHQVDKDLEIFWTLPPATLRKQAELVASYNGVGSITVKDGLVVATDLGHRAKSWDLDELVEMVKKFSKHLPDMFIPVNLDRAPRVLASRAGRRPNNQAYLQSMAKDMFMRSEKEYATIKDGMGLSGSRNIRRGDQAWHQTWASEFRQMYLEACPSASLIKIRPHFEVGRFCSACVKAHSRGQFVGEWIRSLETCNQPDLTYLHNFFLRSPDLPPIRELVPVFSPYKTEGFSDIVLPLSQSQTDKPDGGESFSKRNDTLFWSGSVVAHTHIERALRGGHKTRLLHLINDPNPTDRVTMVLPLPNSEDSFASESVIVREVNDDLSFNVGVEDFEACLSKNCDLVKKMFRNHTDEEDPLNYRYVLLTDEDHGPSKSLLNVIRSQSVPFISTIFQAWYSERLTPWLHFVPIDVRYQALHATLLYFTGTATRARMNGINKYLKGRPGDAESIAQQGQRWAARALRKEDREIYLFRLLLEWGRLIDDRRDSIGYRKDVDGEYRSDEWSRLP